MYDRVEIEDEDDSLVQAVPPHRVGCPARAVALILIVVLQVAILVVLLIYGRYEPLAATIKAEPLPATVKAELVCTRQLQMKAGADHHHHTCSWQFVRYEPSAWESEWIGHTTGGVCDRLVQPSDFERSVMLVARVVELTGFPNTPDHKRVRVAGTHAQGTMEHMRDIADQLFSKMHYELRCDSFVAAEGFDLIEPLVGLLRDPLTICPRPGAISPHLLALYDPLIPGNVVQSKRWLLPQSVTPYQVKVRPAAAAAGGPSWYTSGVETKLKLAIEAVTEGSGVSPWTYSTSVPLHLEATHALASISSVPPKQGGLPDITPSATFLTPPVVDVTVTRVDVGPLGLTTHTRTLSEQEEHTAIDINEVNGTVSVPASLTVDARLHGSGRSRAAPRTILLDLGASYFGRWNDDATAIGSAYFYNLLSSKGLTLDRVYAWEFQPLDPLVEWRMIPSELYSEFTFINTGAEDSMASTSNPWNTLLRVARPIDHVIVKLDIDTTSIEVPLMQQLLSSPALQALVDEMFFEHHVSVPEMAGYLGRGDMLSLGHTYKWFTALRQAGIRMHSWP
jgi:hypothetical protein